MSWVGFPAEGFMWTGPGGEPQWHETFPGVARGFCPRCGSSVASKGDVAGEVGVTMSSLDSDSGQDLVPEHHSFKSDAPSWFALVHAGESPSV